jgi:hypothetical protein
MINVEVTQEDLKNPEVYKALMTLIESLNVEMSVEVKNEKIKKKTSNMQPRKKIHLDPVVESVYGKTINKPKSLFFLTIVKEHGRVSSEQISEIFSEYFDDFKMKAIGGITGALRRWAKDKDMALPYKHSKDGREGKQYFEWVDIPQELIDNASDLAAAELQEEHTDRISLEEQERVIRLMSEKQSSYRKVVESLFKNGSVTSQDFKGDWFTFLNDLVSLKVDYFKTLNQEVRLNVSVGA